MLFPSRPRVFDHQFWDTIQQGKFLLTKRHCHVTKKSKLVGRTEFSGTNFARKSN